MVCYSAVSTEVKGVSMSKLCFEYRKIQRGGHAKAQELHHNNIIASLI